MDPTGAPSEAFTILDVLRDAAGTYRRTLAAHVGWSIAFFALAMVVTCSSWCVLLPLTGIRATGAAPFLGVALYLVLLGGLFVLLALHQGVTLAIAGADRREEVVALGECVSAAAGRLSTMIPVVLARLAVDSIGGIAGLGAIFAVGVVAGAVLRDGGAWMHDAWPVASVIAGGCCIAWAWMLAVRAYLGLASPCAQYEESSASHALRRSVQLLAGRRLFLVRLRVAWGSFALCLYALAYSPLLAMALEGQQIGSTRSPLVLVASVLTYFVALQLLSFDGVIEAALYARVTRSRSVEAVAEVFR